MYNVSVAQLGVGCVCVLVGVQQTELLPSYRIHACSLSAHLMSGGMQLTLSLSFRTLYDISIV